MSYNKNLYIHPENQELLWNNINKIPMFQTLGNGIPNYREQWFKTIIENFYEKYPTVDNKPLLQKINKDTLGYMIEVLKSNMQSLEQNRMNVPQRNMGPANNIPNVNGLQEINYVGKDAEKAQKQELYNRAFGERQKQYEQMFAKPPAPEVDFSEKMDDKPISNIQELIERHKKERETELLKLSALKDFLPPNSPTLPPPILINNHKTDNIDQNNISQLPPQLQPIIINKPENTQVIDQNISYTLSEKNEISDLRKMIENHNTIIQNIFKDMTELKEKYDKIMTFFEKQNVLENHTKNDITNENI